MYADILGELGLPAPQPTVDFKVKVGEGLKSSRAALDELFSTIISNIRSASEEPVALREIDGVTDLLGHLRTLSPEALLEFFEGKVPAPAAQAAPPAADPLDALSAHERKVVLAMRNRPDSPTKPNFLQGVMAVATGEVSLVKRGDNFFTQGEVEAVRALNQLKADITNGTACGHAVQLTDLGDKLAAAERRIQDLIAQNATNGGGMSNLLNELRTNFPGHNWDGTLVWQFVKYGIDMAPYHDQIEGFQTDPNEHFGDTVERLIKDAKAYPQARDGFSGTTKLLNGLVATVSLQDFFDKLTDHVAGIQRKEDDNVQAARALLGTTRDKVAQVNRDMRALQSQIFGTSPGRRPARPSHTV